jgi:hypothetical protein
VKISRLLKEDNALERIEPELNPKRCRGSEQHSLNVLKIVGKVFYFSLAIAKRFTDDDLAMCKRIIHHNTPFFT